MNVGGGRQICGRVISVGSGSGESGAVALEQIVLLAAGALGAFEAANKEKSDSHRDQDGQEIGIRHKPMREHAHILYEERTPGPENPL